MLESIHTADAPAPAGAYSQAIRAGGMLYTAGIIGKDPQTGEVPAELTDEIRQTLANLDAVLSAGGASRETVVKTLCFLVDPDDFALFDAEYREYFGDARPARSTVTVRLRPGLRFEIEAVAVA
jgi:2-iminobutanoate/2-iminopropanoate deaminase